MNLILTLPFHLVHKLMWDVNLPIIQSIVLFRWRCWDGMWFYSGSQARKSGYMLHVACKPHSRRRCRLGLVIRLGLSVGYGRTVKGKWKWKNIYLTWRVLLEASGMFFSSSSESLHIRVRLGECYHHSNFMSGNSCRTSFNQCKNSLGGDRGTG
jgi:hypothetical protein